MKVNAQDDVESDHWGRGGVDPPGGMVGSAFPVEVAGFILSLGLASFTGAFLVTLAIGC